MFLVDSGIPSLGTVDIQRRDQWLHIHVNFITSVTSSHFTLFKFRLHLGKPRIIHKGQKIHSSLWSGDRLNNSEFYTPKACPLGHDSSFWTREKEQLREWIELDHYQHVDNIAKNFIFNLQSDEAKSDASLKSLRELVSNGGSTDSGGPLITYLIKLS